MRLVWGRELQKLSKLELYKASCTDENGLNSDVF